MKSKKEQIVVNVFHGGDELIGRAAIPQFGTITASGTDIDDLKDEFEFILEETVSSTVQAGKFVPQWLTDENYDIKYKYK